MDATFRELGAEPRVEAVPFSHLSIELGHLYMEDFAAGPDRLKAQFGRVVQWARTARASIPLRGPKSRPRVSTCFLIDDYFTQFSSPAAVIPVLLDAAASVGLEIDYLARESACAESGGVPIAEMVAGRLIALPPEGANGSRPPTVESGWLCNGKRSPHENQEAMRRTEWEPPAEIGARNHSVFVDVELWHDRNGARKFSCAYLAAIWQLLRLGVLRHEGASVVRPQQIPEFPERWDELPSIVQLRPSAAPFCGYRTFSVLPSRFLQVEHAVRVILSQTSLQAELLDQLTERGSRDGVSVPRDVTKRIDYVFFDDW
ncbi:MAG: SCO2522 family protein [Kibdelosporangium sp.]